MSEIPPSGVRLIPNELTFGSVRVLEPGDRVRAVATAARDAALAFLGGAPGWGRREVAEWLAGPYRHATRAPVVALATTLEREVASVDVRALADVVRRARRDAVLLIHDLAAGDDDGVTTRLSELGLVAPACDESMDFGLVPVNQPRGGLFDRVASLVAVLHATYGEACLAELSAGLEERLPLLELPA